MQTFVSSALASESILAIYRNNPEVNQPFKVENMFPGDYITKKYQIDVSYTGEIIVYFTADVRSGYAKLSEKLMCKVVMPDEGKLLYDGLMRDMPDKSHILNAGSNGVTDRLNYEISVYLDTSVGNEYQNKDLIADFRWWAYTADEGTPGGSGGESGGIGGGGIGIIPPPTGSVKPSDKPDDGEDIKDQPEIPGGVEDDKPDDPEPPVEGEDGKKPTDSDEADKPDLPQATDKEPEKEERPDGELIPPKTGDTLAPLLWILCILISASVIFVILIKRKKNDDEIPENNNNSIVKKLNACIGLIIVLTLCLCATTFALVYSKVSVEENIFRTGEVKIEIYNDKKELNPIIEDDEFLFEPGMTVVKDFYVKNSSTDPNGIWYKIYFDKVDGGLATVLNVKITDKAKNLVLYNDKAINLTKDKTLASEFVPGDDAWRELSLEFYYPRESGNNTQGAYLNFEVVAEASQKTNNSNKEFS